MKLTTFLSNIKSDVELETIENVVNLFTFYVSENIWENVIKQNKFDKQQ